MSAEKVFFPAASDAEGLAVADASSTAQLLSQHRVQVSIRGQRFETAFPTAVAYCLAFHYFFHLPLAEDGITAGEQSALSLPLSASASPPVWVWQLAVDAAESGRPRDLTAAQLEAVSAVCLRHYHRRVMPALEARMRQLLRIEERGGAEERWAALPPLPAPVSVEFVPSHTQWCFQFLRRPPDDEVEQHKRRLESTKAPAGPGLANVTEEEVLGDPFLLLQPDFAGVLFVFVRRLHAGRDPSFPVRWAELDYTQQVRLAQLVRALGVVPLANDYVLPTAAAAASPTAAGEEEGGGGAPATMLEKAAEYARIVEEQQQQPAVVVDRMQGALDDEMLPPPSQGCYKCGLAGHDAMDCPYS